MMKFKLLIIQFSLYAALSFTTAISEAKELVVRLSTNSFPAAFKEQGVWQGMDVDILNELASRTGLSLSIIEMPAERSRVQMQNGHVDVVTNQTKNKERSAYMHWLGPVRHTAIAFIVREENRNLPIQSLDDIITIANKTRLRIAYQIGSSYTDELDERLKSDEYLFAVTEFLASKDLYFRMIAKDRVLGFFYDDFEALARIERAHSGEEDHFAGLAIHDYRLPNSEGGAYIGLSKKLNKSIVDKLKSAYQKMYTDGTFTAIYKKWSGTQPPPILNKTQEFAIE